MAYTWEEVMLGIDVRKEMSEKAEAQREIERKKAKEEETCKNCTRTSGRKKKQY